MADKATTAQSLERTNAILEMLLDGESRYAIVQYGINNWGLTAAGVDKYIGKANTVISEQAERDAGKLIDKTQRRLIRLLAKANSKNDMNMARLVIKDLRDLGGLDRPTKIEQTGHTDIIVEIVPNEVDE